MGTSGARTTYSSRPYVLASHVAWALIYGIKGHADKQAELRGNRSNMCVRLFGYTRAAKLCLYGLFALLPVLGPGLGFSS